MSYLWSSLRILVISYFASWGSITSRQAIGARVTLQNRVAQFVHKLHDQWTACFPASFNNAHQRKCFQERRVPGGRMASKRPVRPALFCRQCSCKWDRWCLQAERGMAGTGGYILQEDRICPGPCLANPKAYLRPEAPICNSQGSREISSTHISARLSR